MEHHAHEICLCCSRTVFHGLGNVPGAAADNSRTLGSKQCTNTHPHPIMHSTADCSGWIGPERCSSSCCWRLVEVGFRIHQKLNNSWVSLEMADHFQVLYRSRVNKCKCHIHTSPNKLHQRGNKVQSDSIKLNEAGVKAHLETALNPYWTGTICFTTLFLWALQIYTFLH